MKTTFEGLFTALENARNRNDNAASATILQRILTAYKREATVDGVELDPKLVPHFVWKETNHGIKVTLEKMPDATVVIGVAEPHNGKFKSATANFSRWPTKAEI